MWFTLTWSVSLKSFTCMTLNNITIVQYLVENVNVSRVSKYHDFLWRVGKWPIAKTKIELWELIWTCKKVWSSKVYYIYTYTPQNIYTGLCECIWQIFTLPHVNVRGSYV